MEEQMRHRRELKQRHKRQLTVLIAWCAALVVIAAIEVALLIGPEGFQVWKELFPQATPGDYSAFVLTRFLFDLMVPVSLSLYTYFTIEKIGTPPVYRLIWGAVILIAVMWKLLRFDTSSPFWYTTIALMVGLFFTVINLHRLERTHEERGSV